VPQSSGEHVGVGVRVGVGVSVGVFVGVWLGPGVAQHDGGCHEMSMPVVRLWVLQEY
jgi:hypothetical protein